MFLETQPQEKTEYYQRMLGMIGSLSRLFSEGAAPYLETRIAENLFCKSFGAENVSRLDCSVDAKVGAIGIGIKTFLEKNGSTEQKIAEFNSEHALYKDLPDKEKVKKIAELRNARLDATRKMHGLDELIYHCVTRREGGILSYEVPMSSIDIQRISGIERKTKNKILFKDPNGEYHFNISKSTLYKRFTTPEPLFNFDVEILEDPFSVLQSTLGSLVKEAVASPEDSREYVYLPMYSIKNGKKIVSERSGLNQWNAGGRGRHPDEVYIPIPAWIHKFYPGFFPSRDTKFLLQLPDGKEISAKVCQQNSKALMSDPNKDLGQWLLRHVLGIPQGQLVTYENIETAGFDSVLVQKISEGRYKIDFSKNDSFEEFKEGTVASEEADNVD